jgi:hypothetical protein
MEQRIGERQFGNIGTCFLTYLAACSHIIAWVWHIITCSWLIDSFLPTMTNQLQLTPMKYINVFHYLKCSPSFAMAVKRPTYGWRAKGAKLYATLFLYIMFLLCLHATSTLYATLTLILYATFKFFNAFII